jgi:hypothetical protein
MLLFLLLGKIGKCGESVPPKGIDVVPQLGQAPRIEMEIVARAAPFFGYHIEGFEQLEMLRDGGARDREVCREFADGVGTLAKPVEDGLTDRV